MSAEKGTPSQKNICGARARSTGQPCQKPAGWGTDHTGEGRCKLHGGASPVRHGRYSTVKTTELREAIERFQNEEDPLDVVPEIAATRAILQNFLNHHAELQSAILAWYRDEDEKPKKVPQLRDAVQLAESVTRMVKRVEDVRANNAVSISELKRMMHELGRIVSHHVEDQETIDAIVEEWRSVRL